MKRVLLKWVHFLTAYSFVVGIFSNFYPLKLLSFHCGARNSTIMLVRDKGVVINGNGFATTCRIRKELADGGNSFDGSLTDINGGFVTQDDVQLKR